MYRGYMSGGSKEDRTGEYLHWIHSYTTLRGACKENGISLLWFADWESWLPAAEVVFRFPGVDSRADRECEYASERGILVIMVGDRSMEMVAKVARAKLEERR